MHLVKKTVNFDDPNMYHLYFGDRTGRPGTILTFFPIPGARPGAAGTGQATAIGLSVPAGSLSYWATRLSDKGIPFATDHRFDAPLLRFNDPDGLTLELNESRKNKSIPGSTPEENAIAGMHGVVVTVEQPEATVKLLTDVFNYTPVGKEGGYERFVNEKADTGRFIDVRAGAESPRAVGGAGTLHHVALRIPKSTAQAEYMEALRELGYRATPIQDRRYFRSIYFHEPGGVLLELATDDPGFLIDEPLERLGVGLMLPPWLESRRDAIEARLPPIGIGNV